MSDSAIDDREPGFLYGDMPPIRDVSDAVVGMPPREAIRILRARRAEGKTVSDCAKSDAEGTKADVDVFKERRSSAVGTEKGKASRKGSAGAVDPAQKSVSAATRAVPVPQQDARRPAPRKNASRRAAAEPRTAALPVPDEDTENPVIKLPPPEDESDSPGDESFGEKDAPSKPGIVPMSMIEEGPSHIIQSNDDLELYTRTLFALTAKNDPTEAEVAAINLLSLLIDRYESERYPIPDASPLEMLRYLMEQHGLQQEDLTVVLGCPGSTTRLILSGVRNLTIAHINALVGRFHVPASVFLGLSLHREPAKKCTREKAFELSAKNLDGATSGFNLISVDDPKGRW